MRSGTIAFLLGCLLFQQLPELPSVGWAAVPLAGLLLWQRLGSAVRLPAWFSAGFLWSWFHAALILSSGLPADLEGQDLVVTGRIVSIPQSDGRRLRFEFDPDAVLFGGQEVESPGRLRLSWFGGPRQLTVGEQWQLRVRLKRPHGMSNPGGFDYEKWLFSHRIRATGYVRKDSENRRLAPSSGLYGIHRVRQVLRDRFVEAVPDNPLSGIIPALAVGDRSGIDQRQWQVFRVTGTSHLMAISGLHIGLIAAMAFFVARRLWAVSGALCERIPAQLMGAVAGMGAAGLYAALAEFAIPTQRALVMVGVVMAALAARRLIAPSRSLAAALLLVLVLDPLAVLAAGFWLSFLAVAVIFYAMGGRPGSRGLWWRWGRVQVAVAIGLAPATLAMFEQASLISPLANLIAVPWVGMVVVPLTLLVSFLAVLWEPLATPLMELPAGALALLWPLLEGASDIPLADWLSPMLPAWVIVCSGLGVAWLLAPKGWPARWVGLLWLVPLALYRPPSPLQGEAWVTLLDVGQGLSVVVRTERHLLLYDTGPRFGPTFDAGEGVVVPFLRGAGIDAIDTVVVSHGGQDHSGGFESVREQMAVERLLVGGAWRAAGEQEACRRGQRWEWDGVVFSMLHPDRDIEGNDGSCVLKVATAAGSAILTGDIEARAERLLLGGDPELLEATLLIAPHHGSKSSSTPGFVAAVKPELVLFSTGYRNRYGFPHAEVVERYRAAGAAMYETARHGALTVRMGKAQPVVESHRRTQRRYWRVQDAD